MFSGQIQSMVFFMEKCRGENGLLRLDFLECNLEIKITYHVIFCFFPIKKALL